MTPRISLRKCRKCPYYHGQCPLNDLDPCIMAPTEEERMRTRIGLVCTFIVAVICAAVLVFAGCKRGNFKQASNELQTKWSAVELLKNLNMANSPQLELSDFDKLTLAIALTESRFHADAVGSAGDSGVLQLLPCYVAEVNRLYGTEYTIQDAFDIDKSLAIFRALQAHYNPTKDLDKAIYYHNKSAAYKRAVMENYELVCRYEAVRTKLIEK